ncbi:MAG: 50S ribosomal protein L32 [Actinobacteria bacterium]|nr:50S ribosomal protein L32 [Actinomycetota bacterium]
MPVQKKSKSKTRTRRAHHSLSRVGYVLCPKCGSAKLPHAVCENCGLLNRRISMKVAEKGK